MLLVITYSRPARQTLRNVCTSYENCVVRRFGRAVLFRSTELGAFLALRLQEKHGSDVQIERTTPLNEFRDVPKSVRNAANEYENREHPSTPYDKFAIGTTHPSPTAMRDEEL
ncbi:DUF7855 family protein [Haladaptatus caseinilyticus]|uniref:DUF7855 family protein n=1 Tax=Haladaptatus caseinilyticus TaxID=2993314 RepID=UPI00224B7210|nr:hypothetical protein [Haladaptatus caseinilyticus]